jgi:hypothetical protein
VLDERILTAAVKNHLFHFQYPSDDRYLINEYESGFFRAADIVERFKMSAQQLITPIADLFPAYFEDLNRSKK